MKIVFNNIREFIELKDKCVFCGSKLSPTLTNFIGHSKQIPIINSVPRNDRFEFMLNHTTIYLHLKMNVSININTNVITMDIDPSSYTSEYFDRHAVSQKQAREAFESLKPHIELTCNNKNCHMEYYLCSSVLRCTNPSPETGWFPNFSEQSSISSFRLYWEACNVGKFWVQNDWSKGKTNIMLTSNQDAGILSFPIIDFDNFNSEKLYHRVNTLVNFS